MKTDNEVLSEYLPGFAVPIITEWLQESKVQLKITRKRSSKLGDYRPPFHYPFHRISVNHDLNPYHFLLTLVHEFAHVKTWNIYQNKVKPHGPEWKKEFIRLMKPFLTEKIFPADLLPHIEKYMLNPTSSTSNSQLIKHLRNYDAEKNFITLADLPQYSLFRISNAFVFQKLEKIRKRFKCRRMDNNRMYLINPMVYVDKIENV